MGRRARSAKNILVLALWFALVGCNENPFDTSGLFDDTSPGKEHQDDLIAAIDAPKPAHTFETRMDEGVRCFDTFDQFKGAVRKAGRQVPSTHQWHHIVNQNEANKKRLGRRLHCTDNLIALRNEVHTRISAHYSSKEKWTDDKRVREVINARSWSAQYEYGLELLWRHGVEP